MLSLKPLRSLVPSFRPKQQLFKQILAFATLSTTTSTFGVPPHAMEETKQASTPSLRNMASFGALADHSWIKRLHANPETERHAPNHTSREVKSGHYVRVQPTALTSPMLIAVSGPMAAELGLSKEACESDVFRGFFSGDTKQVPAFETWCTPYALSIYGQELYEQCPFGNGNGYGDGRAISVGEVLLPSGARYEMQLKGAGQTPFCRGADGRAVLRSSVREFLASEAMHHLGVSTTRGLSLVTSGSDRVLRAWYSGKVAKKPDISVDDPRLSHIPAEYRQMLIDQMTGGKDPDVRVRERCAITCRVATSFLRVGHVELFGRRARDAPSPQTREELRLIVEHLLEREYPDIKQQEQELQPQVLLLVKQFSDRLAKLTADWIRVGFVQGNFNSDNTLAGGRTMDYGPFGFMQRYSPLWNMWTGGGDKFGFLNQPTAGAKNLGSFVEAVCPLLDEEGQQLARTLAAQHPQSAMNATMGMWATKLGFRDVPDSFNELLQDVLGLMEASQADYTMFWRQLAHIPAAGLTGESSDQQLVAPLADVFYKPLGAQHKEKLGKVLRRWMDLLRTADEAAGGAEEVTALMRGVSPKYVPREWMLVEAYEAAETGDYAPVQLLERVFQRPFDEQPEVEERFYRKAPPETYEGAGLGGQNHMS